MTAPNPLGKLFVSYRNHTNKELFSAVLSFPVPPTQFPSAGPSAGAELLPSADSSPTSPFGLHLPGKLHQHGLVTGIPSCKRTRRWEHLPSPLPLWGWEGRGRAPLHLHSHRCIVPWIQYEFACPLPCGCHGSFRPVNQTCPNP